MKRLMFLSGIITIFMFSASWSATMFSDDFSNCGASNLNWNKLSEDVTINCANGTYTLTNSHAAYGGLLVHYFQTAIPTFTFSGKLSRISDTIPAGFWICETMASDTNKTTNQITQTVVGYSIQLKNNLVYVNKVTKAAYETKLSVTSGYVVAGFNKLTVSKQNSNFNVFVNDHFLGSFTDSEFPIGNIALMVPPKTSAVFDDVIMTDQFTEATNATCFADAFTDGSVTGWLKSGKATVTEAGGYLSVVTQDSAVYMSIDLSLSNFVSQVVVSHRNGSKTKIYGMFVMNADASNTVLFAINANRYYGVAPTGSPFQLAQSSRIKGAAYVNGSDTTFYLDTLQVVKKQGSQAYRFVVNKDTLQSFTPSSNLVVKSIGVYVGDSLNVRFDNFVAAEGTELNCEDNPVRYPAYTMRRIARLSTGTEQVYDLTGRRISGDIRSLNRMGIYIIKNNLQNKKFITVDK